MRTSVMREVGQSLRPQDRVLVGNWNDNSFISDLGVFDTILADYLIGAVDGFRSSYLVYVWSNGNSPYTQDLVIHRLKDHLAPHGSLYIIGMQPIPDTSTFPASIVR